MFNPLSIFYCYNNNKLKAIFYEVKNTFNEQHTYIFKVTKKTKIGKLAKKNFFVSPFMDMETNYTFQVAKSKR